MTTTTVTEPTLTERHPALIPVAAVVALLFTSVIAVIAITSDQSPVTNDDFSGAVIEFNDTAPSLVDLCCESLALTLGAPDRRVTPKQADAFMKLLDDLGFSSAVVARMENTRALDGTQTAESDTATLFWTYHPDHGLMVIIERT